MKKVNIKEPIKVRVATKNGGDVYETIETSVGRLMFNELLPKGFAYMNSSERSIRMLKRTVSSQKLTVSNIGWTKEPTLLQPFTICS
jgi:hypothetical protein